MFKHYIFKTRETKRMKKMCFRFFSGKSIAFIASAQYTICKATKVARPLELHNFTRRFSFASKCRFKKNKHYCYYLFPHFWCNTWLPPSNMSCRPFGPEQLGPTDCPGSGSARNPVHHRLWNLLRGERRWPGLQEGRPQGNWPGRIGVSPVLFYFFLIGCLFYVCFMHLFYPRLLDLK